MTQRLLMLSVVLFFTGCGENSPPPGAPVGDPSPVHGKITFSDGSVLKGGLVTFLPVEPEIGSKLRYEGTGLVDAKGQYKAGFNGDAKGLVPGEYVVIVKPREIGELAGANSTRIPKKFHDKATTTLKATVEEKDNTIDIVLR